MRSGLAIRLDLIFSLFLLVDFESFFEFFSKTQPALELARCLRYLLITLFYPACPFSLRRLIFLLKSLGRVFFSTHFFSWLLHVAQAIHCLRVIFMMFSNFLLREIPSI